jgi:protoporphyrinogen oxidase
LEHKNETYGIIGGGIMGLTLALRLAQQGKKVTIIEAAPQLGGLTASWKFGTLEWDKFYHVILKSDSFTRNILKELNLDESINWVETKTGFYSDGKLYSMSNTMEFLKFPPLNFIDKFRLGLTIIAASKIKNWQKLEKIAVTDWLQKWSGKNTFNKIWLPLLKAKLGDTYNKTSAVFIWATIQRMYSARRSGLKKEMFGYVPGGYKKVINTFTQKLVNIGVEILTNAKVQSVQYNSGLKLALQNGNTLQFDNVISTLPSELSAAICPQLLAEESIRLKNIEYLGVLCVTLVLNKPISNFYVTNVTDTWVPFTGVIEMSALVDKAEFENRHLVYLPKYLISNDAFFNKNDEDIKKYFLDNFKKMYPTFTDENILFVGVAKANHVITVLKHDYSLNLPSIKTSLPGYSIINTSYILDGTLNVNETVKVAETKFKELMHDGKDKTTCKYFFRFRRPMDVHEGAWRRRLG